MPHLLLYRAMLGGAGLAGCVGLLAGQARADIVEFVPVRSAIEAATVQASDRAVRPALSEKAVVPTKAAQRPADRRRAGCDGQRIAMAPSRAAEPL